MSAEIVWLSECPDTASRRVGGKGASLCRLTRAGFAVPDGFVLTADAFRCWLTENALAPLIEELLSTPDLQLPKVARENSAKLRAAVASAGLPVAVEQALLAGHEKLRQRRGGQVVLAVRSSALSEDGAQASSAGLYETVLNVRSSAALLAAVSTCYRSLWAARAVQYRAFKRIDSRNEAMAVVVMEMAAADVAGVAFTANPISGSDAEIMINASWGLGEAIVSGRVTPDNFVVRKTDGAVLTREIFAKELMIEPDPSGASGTVALEVTHERRSLPALNDEQLAQLRRLCLAVEDEYGAPQDIEWALCDDRLYVLQSRPITARS